MLGELQRASLIITALVCVKLIHGNDSTLKGLRQATYVPTPPADMRQHTCTTLCSCRRVGSSKLFKTKRSPLPLCVMGRCSTITCKRFVALLSMTTLQTHPSQHCTPCNGCCAKSWWRRSVSNWVAIIQNTCTHIVCTPSAAACLRQALVLLR